MTDSNALIVLILISSVLLLILAAAVALANKYRKYRSTPYLLASLLYFVQAAGLFGILTISITTGDTSKPFDLMMSPMAVISGFVPTLTLLFYIAEIKFPGVMNLPRCLSIISPVVLLSVLLFTVPDNITEIRTLQDLTDNIFNRDVILRLILMVLYLVYSLVFVLLPYDWRACMVLRSSMILLQGLTVVVIPFFIAGMIMNMFVPLIISFVLIMTIDLFLVQIEFITRIPVTAEESKAGRAVVMFNSFESYEDVDGLMDNPSVWKNPDMTMDGLVKKLGANNSKLAEKIEALGYDGYLDKINAKRVTYICQCLDNEPSINVTGLLFDAGFRSRSRALSEFRRRVGCDPLEYAGRILNGEPVNSDKKSKRYGRN